LLFGNPSKTGDIKIQDLKEAYQFARIVNHHQGFDLIQSVSQKNDWQVNLSEVARIWTEGCIIKSEMMKNIAESFKRNENILFNLPWSNQLSKYHSSIQTVVIRCIENQSHIPCLSAALDYFHGIKIGEGSANLIQAQRDYFGAHTYKLKDDPSEKSYHSDWDS